MERGLGRFLMISCALTVFVGICAVKSGRSDIEEYCTQCRKAGMGTSCDILCTANGRKRSSPSGFNTGDRLFQTNQYKRRDENQQCSLIQLYSTLSAECTETMDLYLDWALRGLQEDK